MRSRESRGTPVIRELCSPHELAQTEELQLLVWGGSERDIFPRDALRALGHIGGMIVGAVVDRQLVGLVVGMPTAQPQVQHSHLLAVHPDWRGTGLALALKHHQRGWCEARGIRHIEWTYDPLRALNAHFNIHRLGCVAHEYLDDFYGEMGGINAGLPSDRLVADWAPSQPARRHPQPEHLPAVNDPDDGTPTDMTPRPEGVRLHIPADLPGLLMNDSVHALVWRLGTRQSFHTLLQRGYRVTDFVRGEAPAYVLTL